MERVRIQLAPCSNSLPSYCCVYRDQANAVCLEHPPQSAPTTTANSAFRRNATAALCLVRAGAHAADCRSRAAALDCQGLVSATGLLLGMNPRRHLVQFYQVCEPFGCRVHQHSSPVTVQRRIIKHERRRQPQQEAFAGRSVLSLIAKDPARVFSRLPLDEQPHAGGLHANDAAVTLLPEPYFKRTCKNIEVGRATAGSLPGVPVQPLRSGGHVVLGLGNVSYHANSQGRRRTGSNNYRGIAVGTGIAKLYATMLNQQLTAWSGFHQAASSRQGGYRSDHRTQDHLLLLRTLVEDHRQRGQPLWVCFVDLAKFFDTVDRQLLWRKLQAIGVSGRMLSAMQAIYAKVPMAVKLNSNLSEPFESIMGVKQGCPLSPTLAGIYLDDFERVVEEAEGTDLPLLQGQPVPPSLWAGDLVTASTTASGQQVQLNLLSDYSDVWRLTVNTNKTEAIVFRRSQQQVQEVVLNS